jgi:hypothetical protein
LERLQAQFSKDWNKDRGQMSESRSQMPEVSRQFSKAWKNAAEIFQALENNPAAFRVAA